MLSKLTANDQDHLDMVEKFLEEARAELDTVHALNLAGANPIQSVKRAKRMLKYALSDLDAIIGE